MATVEQIERALIAADKAGDTQAAQALANALKQARAATPTGWQVQPETPETPRKGMLWPISRDSKGLHFDPSAGILGAAASAAALPGDVYAGRAAVPTRSNPGPTSQVELAPFGFGTGMQFTAPATGSTVGRATDLATFASPAPAVTKWKVGVPTSADLRAVGGAGRDAARAMGVEYTTDSIVALGSKAQQDLLKGGAGPRVAPQTNAVLDDLQKVPNDPSARADFATTIEPARKNLQSIAQGAADAQERRAASLAIQALDEFITKPDPANVLAGPAADLGRTFTEANSNYAAGSRSQILEALGARASGRANATGSGLNLDNTIRGRVATFIEPTANGGPSLAQRAGFTEAEIQLLEKVRDGKAGVNALRFVSNMLGGGGGLAAGVTAIGSSLYTGAGELAMLGAAVPGTGIAAKLAENAIQKSRLNAAATELRTRSASYQQRKGAEPPRASANPVSKAQIIRTLLLGISEPKFGMNPPVPQIQRDTRGNPIPPGTTIY